jgi:hypothetical protein
MAEPTNNCDLAGGMPRPDPANSKHAASGHNEVFLDRILLSFTFSALLIPLGETLWVAISRLYARREFLL